MLTGQVFNPQTDLLILDEIGECPRAVTSLKYFAENFVQQEFAAQGLDPTYSWSDARAEIEFIITDDDGNIIPVEVKSGKRTRAKSLQSYITKCSPHKTIKLTGTQGSSPLEREHIVLPLYYAEYVISQHLRKHQ